MNTSDLDFEPIKIDRRIINLVRSTGNYKENNISGHWFNNKMMGICIW